MSISATQGSNSVINTIQNQIQYIENRIEKIENKQELSNQIEDAQGKLDNLLFYGKEIDIIEISICQQRLDHIKNIFKRGATATASQSLPQRSFNHVALSSLPTTLSQQQLSPSPQPSSINQDFFSQSLSRTTAPQQPQQPTATTTTPPVSSVLTPPVQSTVQLQQASTLSPQEILKRNQEFLTDLELWDRTSYYCTWFQCYSSVEQFKAITETGTLLMTESEKQQFQTQCDLRFQSILLGTFNFREKFKKYFVEMQEQEKEALSSVKRPPNEIAQKHGILTKNPIFLKLLETYDLSAYSQVIYKTKFSTF